MKKENKKKFVEWGKKNLVEKSKNWNRNAIYGVAAFVALEVFGIIGMLEAGAPRRVVLIWSIIALIIMLAIWYAVKKKWEIQRIFLIVVIPIGIMFMLAVPVGRVADEMNHFLRAYSIAQGNLISIRNDELGVGDYVESNVAQVINAKDESYSATMARLLEKPDKDKEKVFVKFHNTSVYNFIAYLPQTVGILIGKVLGLPIMIMAYLGRAMSFAVWVVSIFFCLKYIPILKKSLFFVALLPMSLHQAISLAPDMLTFAAVAGMVTFVLYHLMNIKTKLKRRDAWLIGIISLMLCFGKYIYAPFMLLLFLLPAEKFGGKKRKMWMVWGLFAVMGILVLVWLLLTKGFFKMPDGANTGGQLKYIIGNPLGYLKAWLSTMYKIGPWLVWGTFGEYLEWLSLDLGVQVGLLMTAVAVIGVMYYRQYTINSKVKNTLLLIMFVVFAASFGIEYLQWTPVGAEYIEGMQGRYFLPFLYLIALLPMKATKTASLKQKRFLVSPKESAEMQYHSVAIYSMMFAMFGVGMVFIHHLMM